MNEHILVCVAWPYAKSSTHVGQIVGAYLPADTLARYHRLAGNAVLMVSGSDEHGTPILVDSEREGVSPREFVARYHRQICEVWDRLGMSWDLYTETGTENHYRITQDFFLTLYDKGYIFKDTMQSPYCPTDRRFLPDRYVEGTCPHCGYTQARGDQCDNCGRTLNQVYWIESTATIIALVTACLCISTMWAGSLDIAVRQKAPIRRAVGGLHCVFEDIAFIVEREKEV